jgi:hypothetical protein
MAGLLCLSMVPVPGYGANHREAPITALDRAADITDFFAFVSYDNPDMVTMILNVDPLLKPANGPNYFPFDPGILYEIHVDNNKDAVPDVTFQFRFQTEVRAPAVFTGFVGAGNGIMVPANAPTGIPVGTVLVPPAITSLDGAGAAGLSLRQRYTVTMVKAGNSQPLNLDGTPFFAVPSNVGPRTMPAYAELAKQGIYRGALGIKVFAGTVDDPFYIDLGAAFDTLNLRTLPNGTGVPAVLTAAQDAVDTRNFAPDAVAGFNVNTIAIEVPVTMLTRNGNRPDQFDPDATLGFFGTTSRPRMVVRRSPMDAELSADFRQVQRMGHPLINELLIGTGSKDRFSMSLPKDDAQFASQLVDPLLARVMNAAYGAALPVPQPPRTDLLPLLTYAAPIAPAGTTAGPVADLLRLNTGVRPTARGSRSRLGVLGGDGAGYPNGRRVSDDVTDIALRAVAGILTGNSRFTGFPHNILGDGVNSNDVPYQESFPYVAWAHDGRNSKHQNPGENGLPVD